MFNVSGLILWKGPGQHPKEQSTKLMRDAMLTDSTGSISLSVWEEHISTIPEGTFYTLTDCKVRYFHGKCLSTTKTTVVSEAEKQDVATQKQNTLVNLVCCPEILNVGVNIFLACNTTEKNQQHTRFKDRRVP